MIMKKPKPQALLNAYHRKRNAESLARNQAQPPMTQEQWLKQYNEMKRQKAEYLQKNVIQTDPISGPIQWSKWSAAPDGGFSLGHGVHYHDSARSGHGNDVVAFIRGFRWLRESGEVIQGYYVRPDAITSAEVIADLKARIEVLVATQERHFRPETWITDRICAGGNC